MWFMISSALHSVILFIYAVVAVSLVLAVLFQTSKQEGLGGTLGGKIESTLVRKKTWEENLGRITTFLAILFLVFSMILSIIGY